MLHRALLGVVTASLLLVNQAVPLKADQRGVRVDGKAAVDYVVEPTGQSWAVVIGIDEYRDPKIRRLNYAVADAQAVAEELERRGYQVTRAYDLLLWLVQHVEKFPRSHRFVLGERIEPPNRMAPPFALSLSKGQLGSTRLTTSGSKRLTAGGDRGALDEGPLRRPGRAMALTGFPSPDTLHPTRSPTSKVIP